MSIFHIGPSGEAETKKIESKGMEGHAVEEQHRIRAVELSGLRVVFLSSQERLRFVGKSRYCVPDLEAVMRLLGDEKRT